jgi:hypothetical protein
MDHSHFLLQTWIQWWQSLVALWQSGGWLALYNASENYHAGRDMGNIATGTGAGAAVTSDTVRRLWGAPVPSKMAEDGYEAERNVAEELIKEALGLND